jgi:hypothetical protein
MKLLLYIILSLLLLTPFIALAVTGENTRFDWSLGQPTIVDDSTSACTDTAVARFDWVLGQPAIVHDATANCTAAAGEQNAGSSSLFIRGNVFIKGNVFTK